WCAPALRLSARPPVCDPPAPEAPLPCRLPADVIRPLLARPASLRFIARSIIGRAAAGAGRAPPADPVLRRVATLIRTPPLLCRADEPIREAAKRMTAGEASAVLVPTGEALGIVTDRDLRSRVVAAGASADAPV